MLNILIVSLIIAIFVMICMMYKKEPKLESSPNWTPEWIKNMRQNDVWWQVADLQTNGWPWYPAGLPLLKVNQGWKIPSSALTLYTDKH